MGQNDYDFKNTESYLKQLDVLYENTASCKHCKHYNPAEYKIGSYPLYECKKKGNISTVIQMGCDDFKEKKPIWITECSNEYISEED